MTAEIFPGDIWTNPNFGFRSLGTSDLPHPIFIVGMPRSGSSLVEQILSSHDNVFGGGENTPFNPIVNVLLQRLGQMKPEHTSDTLRQAGQEYVMKMAQRTGTMHHLDPSLRVLMASR